MPYAPARSATFGIELEYSKGVGLCIAIVLADEDDRQLPDGCHVHALVHRTDTCSALAEERHSDLACLRTLAESPAPRAG